MNAIFSLTLVIFCHIYCPHPHGYYRCLCPHHHGFTVAFPPFPRYYRNFRPHYRGYRGFTAVPIPMQLSSTETTFRKRNFEFRLVRCAGPCELSPIGTENPPRTGCISCGLQCTCIFVR